MNKISENKNYCSGIALAAFEKFARAFRHREVFRTSKWQCDYEEVWITEGESDTYELL